MAVNTSWRMGEFLRIVIVFLWNKSAGASTREIMEAVAKSAQLSVEETIPSPDGSGFQNYEVATRSAMTALEKAGWLVREKKQWFLTEEGRLVCKDFRQASDFFVESQRIYENWRLRQPSHQLSIEYAREKAGEQIHRYLRELTQYEFRSLVRDLLMAMGLYLDWVAPITKKRGQIDMIAVPDPLKVGRQYLMVQVKPAGQLVTAEELEALISSIHNDNMVLCISSGGFTEEAKEYACTLAPNKVTLLDLEKFVNLWIDNYEKLTTDARQRFPIEAIHYLSLAE